ncbi:MAG: hypothetical protein J6X28_06180 [Bacilli bacterium]|nr:hypothetical protein [Bacilli bacterium]
MKKNKSMILGFLLLVLSLGLGYAFLTTTLNIEGTTDVDANTWHVYWDNVQVLDGSVEATTPTIDANQTTVTYSAHLSKPGDYFAFTVDAINDGSIDAMIDTIHYMTNGVESNYSTELLPPYIYYAISYSDSGRIGEYHLLESGQTETYLVWIEYDSSVNASDLPSEASSITLSFGVDYVQSDETSTEEYTAYTITSLESFYKRDKVFVSGPVRFNNYNDALNAFENMQSFIRYHVKKNRIQGAELGFVKNGNVYYLYPDPDKFEEQKELLESIFGESNCNHYGEGTTDEQYNCYMYQEKYRVELNKYRGASSSVMINGYTPYSCSVGRISFSCNPGLMS